LVKGFAMLGRFDKAATYAAEVVRLADMTRHTSTITNTHHAVGVLHLLHGDWRKARTFFEHLIALYRAGNVVSLIRTTICSSSWVLAQLGEESEAESRLREGEQLIARYAVSGTVGYRGWAIHALGRACLSLGRLDEAQNHGARVIESVSEHTGVVAYSQHLLGDIATRPDRFDAERGEDCYRQSLALAEPRGMRPLIAHCHLGLGKLTRRTGDRVQGDEHLTIATTMYREMGMRFWIEQAEAELRSVA
jgi:hypothetical protein